MTDEATIEPEPSRPPGPSRAVALTALALLAALFLGLGLVQAWRDAPTYDEPVSLAAGLTAVTRHDLRLNTEHPPLAKALASLPALFARPDIPDEAGWDQAHENRFTAAFVAANERDGTLRSTVFLGRMVPLALAVGTGRAVRPRRPPRRAHGGVWWRASWLTLPPVLGYGHIAGLDVPFAAALVFAALALDRHLSNPDDAHGGPGRPSRRVPACWCAPRGWSCSPWRSSWWPSPHGGRGADPRPGRAGAPRGVGGALGVATASSPPVDPTSASRRTRRRPWPRAVRLEPVRSSSRSAARSGGRRSTWPPCRRSTRDGLARQQVLGDASEESFVLGDYSEEPSAGFWPASLAGGTAPRWRRWR